LHHSGNKHSACQYRFVQHSYLKGNIEKKTGKNAKKIILPDYNGM
jgi:hypothetical protein